MSELGSGLSTRLLNLPFINPLFWEYGNPEKYGWLVFLLFGYEF